MRVDVGEKISQRERNGTTGEGVKGMQRRKKKEERQETKKKDGCRDNLGKEREEKEKAKRRKKRETPVTEQTNTKTRKGSKERDGERRGNGASDAE